MLHRLEQLAPFPAMSIAVVCSVETQGRLNHQVSSKNKHESHKLPLKQHLFDLNMFLNCEFKFKSFHATLQKVPFNMRAEKW